MEKNTAVQGSKLGWFARFVLFMLSSGYLYPHVLTERMDMKAYEAEVQAEKK